MTIAASRLPIPAMVNGKRPIKIDTVANAILSITGIEPPTDLVKNQNCTRWANHKASDRPITPKAQSGRDQNHPTTSDQLLEKRPSLAERRIGMTRQAREIG